MEYGILGTLHVEHGGHVVPVPGLKERAVLGLLLVEAGTVVSADRMIFELWGDSAPRDAPSALRTHVSRLRKALGAAGGISTQPPGYVLSADVERIDAGRFERLADEVAAIRGDATRAARIGRKALAEWRGPALVDLEWFTFAAAEARRLEQRRLTTLETALDAELQLGLHAEAIPELAALTEVHPFHERFWLLLMLALYRADRAGEALEVYRRAEQALGESLGIAPSAALRSLEQAIVLQDSELAVPSIAPPNNLPMSLSSFVGRDLEMAALEETLDRSRLVTLTGVGGSGKSRLALELASHNISAFPDGVWRVELAALRDAEAVPVALSMALGEPGSHATDPVESLIEYLRDRRVLVVLDNCEHLLDTCADLAVRLTSGCRQLTVLATSREPLRVPGETVWLVPPLNLPDPDDPAERQEDTEAFRLFRDRAGAASPSFHVSDDSRPHITALCRRLAGLPLAIELAAARSGAFTPHQLLERLADGLDVLGDRSRTMRGSLEWSHRLLDERLARVFRRLAVFAGSWSNDDAAYVVGEPGEDTVVDVAALVDKSLVVAVVDRPGRYRMLEPVRDFARELFEASEEAGAIRARHADRYLAIARRADRGLRGADQQQWLSRMETDHDNLRTAMAWAIETSRPELALDLVGACGWFWFMAGHWRESWTWLSRALESAGDGAPEAKARAMYRTGATQVIRANPNVVRDGIEEALEVTRRIGDRLGEAWCLHLMGHTTILQPGDVAMSRLVAAREIFEELDAPWEQAWSDRYIGDRLAIDGHGKRGVELQLSSISTFRELGDLWSTAYGLYNLGGLMQDLPGYGPDHARPYLLRSLRISEDIGDPVWAAHAIRSLGISAVMTGSDEARGLLEDAVERFRLIGDETCLSTSLGYLADLARHDERWAAAAGLIADALRIRRRLESEHGIAANLVRLGLLAFRTAHTDEAVRFATAADTVASGWDDRIPMVHRTQHRELMGAVADLLPTAPEEESVESVLPLALELAEMIRHEHTTGAGAGSAGVCT